MPCPAADPAGATSRGSAPHATREHSLRKHDRRRLVCGERRTAVRRSVEDRVGHRQVTDLLAWLLLVLLQEAIVALHAVRQAAQEMLDLSVRVAGTVVATVSSRILSVGLVALGVLLFAAIAMYMMRQPKQLHRRTAQAARP